MQFDIANQPLPPIYKKGNRDCYLDPVREKLIYVTPEETVRQRVISYLINELHVPPKMIYVEVPLSYYGVKSKRRADIIIHAVNDNGLLEAIAVVECKAPGVMIGDAAINQSADYCDMLGCDFAMVANDCACFSYHYDAEKNEYFPIEKFPTYAELLQDKFTLYEPGELPERVEHDKISDFVKENIGEYIYEISKLTEHTLACAAFNLSECLYDTRRKMPTGKYDMFTLIEDYGIRSLSYGNYSGGVFNGLYRSFIVEVNKNTEIVSIGLSTYATYAYPEKEKTSLNVAIDNETDSHHSLQLVLDDNVEYTKNRFTFMHHGRIAVGNVGSGKIDELREYVKKRRPQLIYGKKFFLGTLIDDRNWSLDDEEVVKFTENLISYALIRDEYRAEVKRRK